MAAAIWSDGEPFREVAWHVSTRSGSGGGNCVEAGPVLDGSGRFAVRDSKDRTGAILTYPAPAWTTFLTTLRRGAFKSAR